MHGCENDLQWLKNDFNFDIVGLFDTDIAYKVMENLE